MQSRELAFRAEAYVPGLLDTPFTLLSVVAVLLAEMIAQGKL